ncbi:MAG TPA: HAMP domain-containing sensor histidine kinase [Thermoleophilaceae bacterium]
MSFRTRLLTAALVSLALGLATLLAIGNFVLAGRTRSETSSVLRARAEAQLAALETTRGRVRVRETPNDRALDRDAWVLDGARVIERPAAAPAAVDTAAVALANRGVTAESDAPGDVRLRATPVRAPGSRQTIGSVVVASSVAPLERLRHEVLLGSLVLAAAVLAAAAAAIHMALAAALRPVAEMTESAEDWGAHDLDRRFGLGPPRDELTGLAATLDHLLARIAASRRHEQRFASEVAHELRTPMAGLRGRAELALDGDPDEREQALRDVVAQSERLDATIDALMSVARQELDPASGVVDLTGIARSFEGVELRSGGEIPHAGGDPDVVRRAVAPLVDNARRHARSRVVLELGTRDGMVELRVLDDGPGLDPAVGERAFEPGVRGDGSGDGAGLGLPLARRLARSCGGDVVSRDAAGGCFVLRLPPVAT